VWLAGWAPPAPARPAWRLHWPSSGSSSLFLVAAVALVASGGVAVGMTLTSSSSHRASAPHRAVHHVATKASGTGRTVARVVIPPAPATTTTMPTTTTTTTSAESLDVGAPAGPPPSTWRPSVVPAVAPLVNSAPTNVTDPSVIATATVHTLPLYTTPGAPKPSSTLANPNNLGATLVLLVTGYEPGWVQAYIPVRPNETTRWIPSADVAISFVPDHIVVDLSARTLTLYHDNAPVWETPVAPGEPSSPTPTGSFFVAYIVKLTDPGNVYGPYAMGTSAFSNTYYSFDGGPGQVGIHGTNEPWVIGSYASHGCVRLPNSAITTLAHLVVPGTPVEIEH
jgi:lipoprotein-anchoring transpeptidase ErfK/SrfK